MSNLIQYFQHVAIEPLYYYRCFENDFSSTPLQEEHTWTEVGKRCALVALPFLSLYKPLGTGISIGMGCVRSMTSLFEAWSAGQREDVWECAAAMFRASLAGVSVVATFFCFTGGLFLITGIDTLTSGAAFVQHLTAEDWQGAFEEFLQIGAGTLYCTSMVFGHLEIVLLISILQGILSLYQARKEFIAGRYPEAIAKGVMSGFRLHQAKTTFDLIERRNELLAIEEYRQWMERAHKGRVGSIGLIDSALGNLLVVVKDKEVILTDAMGKTYSFGSHMHGHGQGVVKGANLTFRQVNVNGENKIELDFKVNHVFSARMHQLLQEMQHLGASERKEILALSHSHVSDIHIQKAAFPVGVQTMGPAIELQLEGLGTILVGSAPEFPNLYDRVIVRLEEGKSLQAWHEALSFLDLDAALRTSSQEDLTRIKIGQLFRTMHPREATQFERTDAFFTLPLDQLKQRIIEQMPDMKTAFLHSLDKMQEHEILPGRIRYSMPGIAEQSYALGARGLIAAVTGAYSNQEVFDRVGSMLTLGMLSSETRYSNGISAVGLSLSADFKSGGADSVYTQMITQKNCADHMPLNALFYNSQVKLVIALDALETGSYQYHHDAYGSRCPKWPYFSRPSIFEFTQKLSSYPSGGHEVCFKERIPPHLIQGLIVQDVNTRNALMDYLSSKQIIQKNEAGQEMIFNHLADQFIRVETRASETLFA